MTGNAQRGDPERGDPKPGNLPGAVSFARLAWTNEIFSTGARVVPEELPIALSYNRMSHAVMLASPVDLEDFAIGFSLADGIIDRAEQIEAFDLVPLGEPDGPLRGIEARMQLAPERLDTLDKRRRHVAGPSGCGLCGLESLEAALRPMRIVAPGPVYAASSIAAAVASLRGAQAMNRATRAVHAAGFWTGNEGLQLIREDVGRHNALDKLHGALARVDKGRADKDRAGVDRAGVDARGGIVVMTSRVSVELVQKAAAMQAPVLAAISAPTSLAIATAREAGITLVAVARDDGFEIFTHPERITGAATD